MTSQMSYCLMMMAAKESKMTPQMRNLLIMLGAIAVILILVVLFFSGSSPFMKLMNLFLEDTEGGGARRMPSPRGEEEHVQKSTSEPIVEMATLVRKSDDRLRVIESSGQERLIDEVYELEFMTRKGQKLKIECSRQAYEKIPFNQQGSLTYKRNTLVKFKYYEDIVYNS